MSSLLSFTWNGYTSTEKGVTFVTKLPQPSLPKRKAEIVTVPGRSGNLTIFESDTAYEAITKQLYCKIEDLDDVDDIFTWLQGSGDLILSDRPTRAYRATIVEAASLSRWGGSIREFVVEFNCYPYSYEAEPSDDIELETNPDTVVNTGGVPSEPIIVIEGSGDITLTINSDTINLTDITTGIVLDSEQMNAYLGETPMNDHMTGEFPLLVVGNNTISWIGTVTSIVITPNWRWLG